MEAELDGVSAPAPRAAVPRTIDDVQCVRVIRRKRDNRTAGEVLGRRPRPTSGPVVCRAPRWPPRRRWTFCTVRE